MTKPLPQIICLHGRGSNAQIMKFQMMRITAQLGSIFEFVFLNGPFEGEAGPGILPWFEGMEPYFTWGSASIGSGFPEDEEKREMKEVNRVLDGVLEGRQARRVVGVLGFSQGTRVASGLVRRQEVEVRNGGVGDDGTRAFLRFGIFVCGGGGLSFKPFDLVPPPTNTSSNSTSEKPSNGSSDSTEEIPKIKLQTLHIHGRQDAIAQKGKEMVETWFEEGDARVLDVEAGHHFPRAKEDVDGICRSILEMWEKERREWEEEMGY